jgi:hypothetical protein
MVIATFIVKTTQITRDMFITVQKLPVVQALESLTVSIISNTIISGELI